MANEPKGYFTKEAASVLPKFSVNKIIVSKNNIRCMCSMDRETNLNYDSWLGSSDFLKYINFYFVVSTRMNSSSMSKFYFAKTRVSSLTSDNNSLVTWEDQVFDPNSKAVHGVRGALKANMNEIIVGNYFIKSKTAEQSQGSQPLSMGDVEELSSNDISSGDNTYFEVEIPMDSEWDSISEDPNQATNPTEESIDLIAFAQLDVKTLSEEFNLDQFTGKLAEYGGPMVYQRLLELSPAIAADRPRYWIVPSRISVFFDEDGKPYKGPSHYRTNRNPGPDGYTGYLSGPTSDDLEVLRSRKRLTKREIPNNKVVSKLFMERELDPNGNPLDIRKDESGNEYISGRDTRFSGFQNQVPSGQLETTQNAFASPYGNLSFGEDLLSTLKSEVGMLKLASNSGNQQSPSTDTLYGRRMRHFVLSSQKSKASYVGSNSDNNTSLEIGSDPNESFYLSLFNINIENLIKSNSPFGYFVDFHRQSLIGKESVSQINNEEFSPEAESYSFIEACITQSSLYNLGVSRERVTNSRYSNNSLGMPVYETKDSNEIAEAIITNARGTTLSEVQTNSNQAQISSIAQAYSELGFMNVLELRDFDLFRNYSQGNYQYSLQLTLRDGIRHVLESMYRNLSESVNMFSKYVEEASRPFVTGPYDGLEIEGLYRGMSYTEIDAPVTTGQSGNYNYERGRFTDSFASRQEEFREMITTVVEDYIRASYIMTRRASLMDANKRDELVRFLLPQAADLGNLKMFLNMCCSVEQLYKNKIFSKNEDIENTLNYGTFKRSVSCSREYQSNLIKVNTKMPNIVKTCSKNSIFYSATSVDEDQDSFSLSLEPNFFSLVSQGEQAPLEDENTRNGSIGSAGQPIKQSLSEFFINNITPSSGENLEAAIMSAIEDSSTRETFDAEARSSSDPLRSMNALLSSFGGTTFGYLLSRALNVSETGEGTCSEIVGDDGIVIESVQDRIAEAAQTSEDEETFVREVEESYENQYFAKEALGELYGFIGQALAINKKSEDIKQKITYKEMVLKDKPRDQIKSDKYGKREVESMIEKARFDVYEMDITGAFVPAGTSNKETLGIFKLESKSVPTTSTGKSAVATNTIVVKNSARNASNISLRTPSATRRNTNRNFY